MVRKHAFDVYIPLAQDEMELPLYDVIQNLNWLIGNALHFDAPRIAIFMSKYDTLLKGLPTVHATDQTGNPIDGVTSIGDANFIDGYFDAMFCQMESYPIMSSPMSMIANIMPADYVLETWKIITTCQILLPCVVNLKRSLERQYGKKNTNAIIICSIEEYLKRRNPVGYAFIQDIIAKTVNANRKADWDPVRITEITATVCADVFLDGLTRLSLIPTHYLNMCDVAKIVGDVVMHHRLLMPDVLPETTMY